MIYRVFRRYLYFVVRSEILKIERRQITAKAFILDLLIGQERKLWDRRRSDTVVVSTLNDIKKEKVPTAWPLV
eukprot:TRINITY_DN32_c0_g1_i16.p1 TRINITY_DN32_c0_g1~~TRINITY_DN32_c0_g1_i16.p1  ORF type:complete len:73 (-),score=18.73 TRINITY_DN32_c0_g1_i16:28-246(-)